MSQRNSDPGVKMKEKIDVASAHIFLSRTWMMSKNFTDRFREFCKLKEAGPA